MQMLATHCGGCEVLGGLAGEAAQCRHQPLRCPPAWAHKRESDASGRPSPEAPLGHAGLKDITVHQNGYRQEAKGSEPRTSKARARVGGAARPPPELASCLRVALLDASPCTLSAMSAARGRPSHRPLRRASALRKRRRRRWRWPPHKLNRTRLDRCCCCCCCWLALAPVARESPGDNCGKRCLDNPSCTEEVFRLRRGTRSSSWSSMQGVRQSVIFCPGQICASYAPIASAESQGPLPHRGPWDPSQLALLKFAENDL